MHQPVLLQEVLKHLDPKPNQNFIDGTLGEGGHAQEILKLISPNGKLLGIDLDQRNLNISQEKFLNNNISKERFILVQGNFKNIKQYIKENNFQNIQGILLDLGLNSYFLDESERGFTFRKDEKLDMRFDPDNNELTAYEVINTYPEKEIADIIYKYGEERFSRIIAKKIVNQRRIKKIETTYELAQLIGNTKGIARVFQAIRIYVNKELENLETVIPDALDLLTPTGKLAIISFHSLEDRIVKNLFKQYSLTKNYTLITKKPITASKEELIENHRSHSAKMRIIQKK
jgi:16S rRNA (cytosine1402-N4)-methyltransferase